MSFVLLANVTGLTATCLTGLVSHTGATGLSRSTHWASAFCLGGLLVLGFLGVLGLSVFFLIGFLLLGRFLSIFASGFTVAAFSGVFVVVLVLLIAGAMLMIVFLVACSIIVVVPALTLNFRLLFALTFAGLGTNLRALFMRPVRVGTMGVSVTCMTCFRCDILLNRSNRLCWR